MSRSVQRLSGIEVIGDLDWPNFLSESPRAYAKSHRSTHWIKLGENLGFFTPEPLGPREKAFPGALYSIAALVYGVFDRLAAQSDRTVGELDVLVLLPCANADEVAWVRIDDGVITQDLIMTGLDALERLRHLPSYVTVYSALDGELPHSNIKPFSWRVVVQTLSREARIRGPLFQLKGLSNRAKLFIFLGGFALVALSLGGFYLYKHLKPKPVAVAPIDHTDQYWVTLSENQQKSADKRFAQKVWDMMLKQPLVEDGWSRVRMVCRPDQCNTEWKMLAGGVQTLEAKYKVASFTGDAARTEAPNDWKFERSPFDLIESQELDKQMSAMREKIVKSDTNLTIEVRNPSQVTFPGMTHVKRFANQRVFVIKGNASSFAEILESLPDYVVIDLIELTVDTDPKLIIEGKVYVL
ncbi:MAG: hypothetical protein QM527_14570 [Alphaproteobacteria bacterium]|nr:hypothetical protein [Alphaproteobacteria bacterium]